MTPRSVKNDVEGAKLVFGGGMSGPEFSFRGVPVLADFPLTYGNLSFYVHQVLDQATSFDLMGIPVFMVRRRP